MLVTAVEPRMSDTKATTVMLNPFVAVPGGIWVSRKLDEDTPVESFVIESSLVHAENSRMHKVLKRFEVSNL